MHGKRRLVGASFAERLGYRSGQNSLSVSWTSLTEIGVWAIDASLAKMPFRAFPRQTSLDGDEKGQIFWATWCSHDEFYP